MPKGYRNSDGKPHSPPHASLRAVEVPIGPSIAYVPLTKGQFALIDRDDADWVGRFNWNATWRPLTGDYAAFSKAAGVAAGIKGNISMHAALLGLTGRKVTADHIIPGNGLDNRRCNLRPASHAQQSRNRRRRSDNLSGFKGVTLKYYGKKRMGWLARIMRDGEYITLGYYGSPEAAHEAYKAAAKEHYGEFARSE